MEFIDLKAQQARIKTQLDSRMAKVLAHGQYIMGPEVRELETVLARYVGAEHCIGCASGTTALELVLAAWGIGKGDAVFTSPLSFIATAETIAKTGATPVFVDIDSSTYNMDAALLEAAIMAVKTRDRSYHPLPTQAVAQQLSPRAVVVVDLFGTPADYARILPVAQLHNLLVLEDGAQAFGGSFGDKALCNCGCHAATTSFFPAKPLGCYGDGGAVFTNDASLAAVVDSLRYHGRVNAQNKNENIRLGCNGRLDTLQAAVLLAKMDVFPQECTARQAVAARYTEKLAPYAEAGTHVGVAPAGLSLPRVLATDTSAWAQYTVQLPVGCNRSTVMAAMKEQGIPTCINYPMGMHTQGCLHYLGYTPHDFPKVQALCQRVLSLPMHPYLSETDQDSIVAALLRACGIARD